MKNPWSDRWVFVKDYIPNHVSIIDFGCGNKESLDYITPTQYLGVDCLASADLVADLNKPFSIDNKFDVALLLGVLEYLDDPEYTLKHIVPCADCFIILSLVVKQKAEWRRAFTEDSITKLLSSYFQTVDNYQHGRYILSVCKK
jgi:hypothetical protein